MHHLKNANGDWVSHPQEKAAVLEEFLEGLFKADEEQAQLPSWIWNTWNRPDLAYLGETINGRLLRELILERKANKTSADDLIVNEVLKQLDEDVLQLISEAFVERLLNTPEAALDQVWDEHTTSLLAKKTQAHLPSHYRPIAILPALYKLYSKLLHSFPLVNLTVRWPLNSRSNATAKRRSRYMYLGV